MGSWTFLSTHGQVLLAIAMQSNTTEREIALSVGITERAVQRIISDLEAAGYLTRTREGWRNRYVLHPELPLRHQLASGVPVGELLRAVGGLQPAAPNGGTPISLTAGSATSTNAAPGRPG